MPIALCTYRNTINKVVCEDIAVAYFSSPFGGKRIYVCADCLERAKAKGRIHRDTVFTPIKED